MPLSCLSLVFMSFSQPWRVIDRESRSRRLRLFIGGPLWQTARSLLCKLRILFDTIWTTVVVEFNNLGNWLFKLCLCFFLTTSYFGLYKKKKNIKCLKYVMYCNYYFFLFFCQCESLSINVSFWVGESNCLGRLFKF